MGYDRSVQIFNLGLDITVNLLFYMNYQAQIRFSGNANCKHHEDIY